MRLLRAIALGSTLLGFSAQAQFTANASVVSDYRFRGVSLSDEKPAVQASINWDGEEGPYAGAFASTVQLHGDATTTGQGVLYLGVAVPAGDGSAWDLGADYSAFSVGRSYDYGEAYVGIASRQFTARMHYSPNYFGFGRRSLYGEINAKRSLADGFVLLAHVGVLIPVGQSNSASGSRNALDARLGVGVDIGGFNVELAWVGTTGTGYLYPVYGSERRNTVVASISKPF